MELVSKSGVFAFQVSVNWFLTKLFITKTPEMTPWS